METEILRLNLAAPLYFAEARGSPFGYSEETGGIGEEKLFCFDLDKEECRCIEPDGGRLLGNPAAAGCRELPKGNYLFAQKRELLSREKITALAVEIQQEGLWQRLEPGGRLYLRYLFEDGKNVTQLFRPYRH